MALSLFDDKSKQPTKQMLVKTLGKQYQLWADIAEHIVVKYSKAAEEWKYPGTKYGWSFRLKDKKRNIIYMTPSDGYIMVAFVFGDKAVDDAQSSSVPQPIKDELRNKADVANIKTLVGIKLAN